MGGSLDSFLSRLQWRAGAPLAIAGTIASVFPGSVGLQLRDRVGKLRAAVENAMRLAKLYSVYTIERFEFQSQKSRAFLDGLNEMDQRRFNTLSCADINWKAYFRELHIPGMRKYVLKEPGVEPMRAEETHALSRQSAPLSRL